MNIQKIFSGTIDLNPTYHGWSTVAITKTGELLAVCSGNRVAHVCPFGRTFFYRSSDGGKTWTGPEVLSKGPLDDRDAGICIAADGSVLVNYFTSTLAFQPGVCWPEWEELAKNITPEILAAEHGLWMRRSTDNGKTWSEKYRTPVNNPHGPVLLKSGRLFMPGKLQADDCSMTAMMLDEMGVAVSDDNGVTWQLISRIPAPAGHDSANCHELHAVEAYDGRIIVQIRDETPPHGSTWQTESKDGGLTWSEPHKICNGFPSHLIRFGGDKLLTVYGWRDEPDCGIRAMVSEDSGRTWGDELILYREGLNRDLGYPSTVEMPDGSLFTLWYENNGQTSCLNYCNWQIS